jgi:outer membrane protein
MTAYFKFRKILIGLFFVLFSAGILSAQKFVFVDVNRIMESIEDYQLAQEELDRTAAKWRQEIAQEYDKIKGMYNRYQAEQVLLSDEARQQREDEIMAEEKTVRDRQKDYFGPEGALFERRQTLVKPIQDRVYAAIEEYANERGYDFVFDLSSNMGLIFSNPEYDKTEDLLRKLR